MREFSESYLTRTRRGLWAESCEALEDLNLATRKRVLDVGCGTGELTRVLAEQTPGEVIGVDANRSLLDVAAEHVPVVAGDATRLPFADDAFDLVVCQALLINLPDPTEAIEEFARVSRDLVAAIEPDNAAVTVESTVAEESRLAARAREAYLAGVDTDVAFGGSGTRSAFEDVGLEDLRTTRYEHTRIVEPPYSAPALDAARRKATGQGIEDRRKTMLAGELSDEEYDALRSRWRAMGRETIEQMRDGEYRRREVVPLYVTVGQVSTE